MSQPKVTYGMLDQSDLYRFNQLIHKLDDAAGGDYQSQLAFELRLVRDRCFTNGRPARYVDHPVDKDALEDYLKYNG